MQGFMMHRALFPLLLAFLTACQDSAGSLECWPTGVTPLSLEELGLVIAGDTLDVTDTTATLLTLHGLARMGYENTHNASVTVIPPSDLDGIVQVDDSTLAVPAGAEPGTWRIEMIAVTYPVESCSSLGGGWENTREVTWSHGDLAAAGYPADVEVVNQRWPDGGVDIRSGYGTAVVDGVVDPEEWETAATYQSVLFMHSRDTMYIGLRTWIGTGDDHLDIWLDRDRSGDLSPGDDVWWLSHTRAGVLQDGVVTADGSVVHDTTVGGTADGLGMFLRRDHQGYEIAHPLNSGDPNDIDLTIGGTIPVMVRITHTGEERDLLQGWQRVWLLEP